MDDDDSRRPVAYDAEGRPLYTASQQQEQATGAESAMQTNPVSVTDSGKQVVHVARSTEPIPVHISEETRRKHEESCRLYPWLNLSEHEYVIQMIPRHSIGIWGPTFAMILAIILVSVFMFCYPDIAKPIGLAQSMYPQVILICLIRYWFVYSDLGIYAKSLFLDQRKCYSRNSNKLVFKTRANS